MRPFKFVIPLLLLYLLSATPTFASFPVPTLSEVATTIMKVIIFQMPFGFIATFLIGKSNFSSPSIIGILKILILSAIIGPLTLIFAIAIGILLSQLSLGLGGVEIYAPVVIIILVLIIGFIALVKEYRHNSLLRMVCYQSAIAFAIIFSGMLIVNTSYFCGMPNLISDGWFHCVRYNIFGTFETIGLIAIFITMVLLYFGQKQKNSTFIPPPPPSNKLKIILAILIASIILGIVYAVIHTNLNNETRRAGGNGPVVTYIDLTQTPDSKTAVYEGENIIITFSLNDFEQELLNKINESPVPLDEDKTLLTFIQVEKEKGNKVIVSSLDWQMQKRADYVIASLLEAGKCTIFDIHKNVYIPTIKIESYYDQDCPKCGPSNRSFILPEDNSTFFYILYWL